MIDEAAADAFAKLGLAPDADVRAVKQAYARQLKQIDPSTELEAFQALRRAYEQALSATRRVGAPAEQPTAPAEVPARLQDSSPLNNVNHALAAGLTSTADAIALLRATLGRLESLDAGARLERQVAELLVRGWQPGHEFLFDAARDAFRWAEDRRQLLLLGETGAVLQEALIEQQVFLGQPPEVLDRQLRLVRRLRDATPPSRTLQRDEKPLLQVLVRRYRHWLPLVVPVHQMEHWLGGPQALEAALAMPEPRQQVVDADGKFAIGRLIFFLLWLAFLAWRHFG